MFGSRRVPRVVCWPLLAAIAAGALALRLPTLSEPPARGDETVHARPMHGDEAVHTVKCWSLYRTGRYRYDPNEFHGPTLYYATLPVLAVRHRSSFGDTTESDYRLVTVLFGAGLILLLALFADGIGWAAVLVAAALLAVSPAFVFYSRYYIQEMLLAFFTVGAIGCGWRYACSRRFAWLVAASVCVGLMLASKETAPLAIAASALGLWVARRGRRTVEVGAAPRYSLTWQHAAVAAGIALVVAALFLSGFGSNLTAPLGYLQSYTPWLHRARTGALHNQPWYYYLSILGWTHRSRGPLFSEALVLALGLVGVVAAAVGRRRQPADADPALLRYLAMFTLALTALYSAIPYKTPWCVLSFLAGFALLGGYGAVWAIRALPGRALRLVASVALLAGIAQLGIQAQRGSFVYYADGRNPYVYGHPVPDVVVLGRKVDELARAHPQRFGMMVKVLATDDYYWPLPWYLRRFPNVGYWTHLPPDPDAPVALTAPAYDEELTRRWKDNHFMTGYGGLRPGVSFMVWVQDDLWMRHLRRTGAIKPPAEAP